MANNGGEQDKFSQTIRERTQASLFTYGVVGTRPGISCQPLGPSRDFRQAGLSRDRPMVAPGGVRDGRQGTSQIKMQAASVSLGSFEQNYNPVQSLQDAQDWAHLGAANIANNLQSLQKSFKEQSMQHLSKNLSGQKAEQSANGSNFSVVNLKKDAAVIGEGKSSNSRFNMKNLDTYQDHSVKFSGLKHANMSIFKQRTGDRIGKRTDRNRGKTLAQIQAVPLQDFHIKSNGGSYKIFGEYFDAGVVQRDSMKLGQSAVGKPHHSMLLNGAQAAFINVFQVRNRFRTGMNRVVGQRAGGKLQMSASGGGGGPENNNNDDDKDSANKKSKAQELNQQALQAMPKPFTEEQIRMADPAADIIIPKFMQLKQETVDGLFSPSDANYRKRKEDIFKNCDKDGDGVLSEAEYIDLQMQNIDLWKEQYGEAPQISKEELQRVYAIKDKFQPETDGITLEDFRLLSEALVRHPELKLTRRGDVGEETPLDKVKGFFGFKKDGQETENPIQQIKALGVAGAVSYALWEGAFWTVGGGGAIVAYFFAFGHWPDFSNQDDMSKLGAEAFAFVNLARFIVPLRIGLAVGTAPWVDENIVQRFNMSKNNDEKDENEKEKTSE